MTHPSPQFTAAQVLEAGQRAEAEGQLEYALQFYHYLTENYANTSEAMIAREALNRLAVQQSMPQMPSGPVAQQFVQPQLPASAGYGGGAAQVPPEANGGLSAYPHQLPHSNGAIDPYAPGLRMPSVVQRPNDANATQTGVILPESRDRYAVGGMIATAVSAIGWLVAVMGIAAAVLGLGVIPRSGAIIGFVPGLIYGVGGLAVGLGMVLAGQMARALFNSANATRDLVIIERAKARQLR